MSDDPPPYDPDAAADWAERVRQAYPDLAPDAIDALRDIYPFALLGILIALQVPADA